MYKQNCQTWGSHNPCFAHKIERHPQRVKIIQDKQWQLMKTNTI